MMWIRKDPDPQWAPSGYESKRPNILHVRNVDPDPHYGRSSGSIKKPDQGGKICQKLANFYLNLNLPKQILPVP